MESVTINLTETEENSVDAEFVDLGKVSEETKGGFIGGPDGGAGMCIC